MSALGQRWSSAPMAQAGSEIPGWPRQIRRSSRRGPVKTRRRARRSDRAPPRDRGSSRRRARPRAAPRTAPMSGAAASSVSRKAAKVRAIAPISSAPAGGDRHGEVAGVEAVHRDHQTAQRNGDRAQHQQGQNAPTSTAAETTMRDSRVAAAAPATSLLARSDAFRGSVSADDRARADRSTATLCSLACASSELPMTAVVVGVFVDRLAGEVLVLRQLAADCGDGLRAAPRQHGRDAVPCASRAAAALCSD